MTSEVDDVADERPEIITVPTITPRERHADSELILPDAMVTPTHKTMTNLARERRTIE